MKRTALELVSHGEEGRVLLMVAVVIGVALKVFHRGLVTL